MRELKKEREREREGGGRMGGERDKETYAEAVARDTQVLQPGQPADDGRKVDQQTCEDLR